MYLLFEYARLKLNSKSSDIPAIARTNTFTRVTVSGTKYLQRVSCSKRTKKTSKHLA
jgi:hypothetical protein